MQLIELPVMMNAGDVEYELGTVVHTNYALPGARAGDGDAEIGRYLAGQLKDRFINRDIYNVMSDVGYRAPAGVTLADWYLPKLREILEYPVRLPESGYKVVSGAIMAEVAATAANAGLRADAIAPVFQSADLLAALADNPVPTVYTDLASAELAARDISSSRESGETIVHKWDVARRKYGHLFAARQALGFALWSRTRTAGHVVAPGLTDVKGFQIRIVSVEEGATRDAAPFPSGIAHHQHEGTVATW